MQGFLNAHLQGIHIMSDDNQLGLFLLDQVGNGVDSRANHRRALGRHISASLHTLLSPGRQTGLLLLLALRLVLVEQTEKLGSSLFVKGLVELVDGRGDLQTLQQNRLLALKANVLGPSHETSQITLGLNVLAWQNERRGLNAQGVGRLGTHQCQSS
jgi:hypothetical protein